MLFEEYLGRPTEAGENACARKLIGSPEPCLEPNKKK